MPEQSKFSAILKKKPTAETRTSSLRASVAPAAEGYRGPGRPPGKRSNPDFERLTVLLRKDTRKVAARLWEDAEPEKDLSDLVEMLLTEWTERQKKSKG